MALSVLINVTDPDAPDVRFADQQVIPAGDVGSVAAADVNGDGKADLIVTQFDVANSTSDGYVWVLINTTPAGSTNASFADPQMFDVGANSWYVTTADLNGDGKPDIVTSSTWTNTISILLNTTANGSTTPSFSPVQKISTGDLSQPDHVTTADINGDGKPDLSIGTGGGSTVAVMINTTAKGANQATFAPMQTFEVGHNPYVVTSADMNRDGKPDLIAANENDNTLSVLMNSTLQGSDTVTFLDQQVFAVGLVPYPVVAADLNGDGSPDLISVNIDNTISLLFNTSESNNVCVSPSSVVGTIQYNVVPPVITLTSPSGEFVTASSQLLAGKVSKPGALSINGTNVPLNSDGTFSYTATLQSGKNEFTLVATDLSGNITTLNQTIVLQSLVSVGTDMQFQPGPDSGTLTLVGQPGAAIQDETVTVTDVTTGISASGTVNADGSYSVTITGSNTDNFSVVLSGTDGTSGAPIYLHGNDAVLGLSVAYPANGATIDGDRVTVRGTYTGATDIGITVNGEAAMLTGGQFIANNVPLAMGANTLAIVATEEGGLTTAQTLNITSTGTSPIVLSATSATGVTPLTVSFTYQYEGTTPIQTLEMSYLGNGKNDVVSSDSTATLNYTYTAPGIYPATLTLIDANGMQYQAVLDVVVQDPAQMDTMFKTLWGDMTAGLAGGNKAAAMSVLDYSAQQKYGPVFDALLPHMQQIVGSFSPLLRGDITGSYGEYAVVRQVNGQAYLYFIYFIQDEGGVWHLDAM